MGCSLPGTGPVVALIFTHLHSKSIKKEKNLWFCDKRARFKIAKSVKMVAFQLKGLDISKEEFY